VDIKKELMETDVLLREEKSVEDYITLFRKAEDFDITRFDEYIEYLAFYEGRQNFLSAYAGEKPWVVDINTTYAADAIDIRVSSLLANDYKGELEPLSAADVEPINNLNAVYSNFWDEMNMDKHITRSIADAAVIRESYTHIIYDDDTVGSSDRMREGKLVAYSLDPASVLIDPAALSLKDADYVIIRERITPRKVIDLYPDFDFESADKSSMFTPQERGEMVVGNDFMSEQERVLTKLTFYEVKNNGRKNQEVWKTVIIENQFVEESKKLPINCLPIAQFRWEKKHKSPYGLSLMDRLIAQQKAVNATESAIINTALQFAAPSFIVNVDSGLNPEDVAVSAGMPAAVYPVAGVQIDNAIRPLFSGKAVDQTMVSIKMNTVDTIYKMAGVTQEFIGSLGSSGNTSGGSNIAIQRAKIIEQKILTHIEEYVEDITYIMMDYITKVFGGETIYTRGEKRTDGGFNFNKIEVPEVDQETFSYTFSVNLDVKTKYSKDQNKQLMLELFQMERQYNQGEPIVTSVLDVLKQYNVPERYELIERQKMMMRQDDAQKAQAIMQITQAALQYGIDPQMLQQAIAEIMSGKQETPTVDAILQMIEQTVAQQNQQIDRGDEAARQESFRQPAVTGDEELSAGEQGTVPVTGDEELTLGM
jgi:hypothetical protein